MNDEFCLVTSSIESTWDFSGRNLFLGELTRIYSRRFVWNDHRPTMCAPWDVDTSARDANFLEIQALSKQLLLELAFVLNTVHDTVHERRYWNIVLGHWLQRYINVISNRYNYLRFALNNYEISHTYVLPNHEIYDLSSNDSISFIYKTNDPFWNHFLYAKILSDISNLELRPTSVEPPENNELEIHSLQNKPRKFSSKFFNYFFGKLHNKYDAFVVNTYLPRMAEVLLNIKLGQFPQFWGSPNIQSISLDSVLRAKAKSMIKICGDGFERVARAYLIDCLPRCYLEGYSNLQQAISTLQWPSKPKFIFTSNRFDTDEAFKVWAAGKVEEKVPYIVGQHGSGYGTHRYLQTSFAPEVVDSDKFISWGSANNDVNVSHGFIFKTAGIQNAKYSKKGGLLLIAPMAPNQTTHWDSLYEFSKNQEFQFEFVEALPAAVRDKVLVRLAPGFNETYWDDHARWLDYDSSINCDTGSTPFRKNIQSSRLVVFFYDSTGFLELLSLNIPVIGLWYGGLDHLLPEAKLDYQRLVDVDIIHLTPHSGATWVANRWEEIEIWWNSDPVRCARDYFCERYAKKIKSPVNTLSILLNKAVNENRRLNSVT